MLGRCARIATFVVSMADPVRVNALCSDRVDPLLEGPRASVEEAIGGGSRADRCVLVCAGRSWLRQPWTVSPFGRGTACADRPMVGTRIERGRWRASGRCVRRMARAEAGDLALSAPFPRAGFGWFRRTQRTRLLPGAWGCRRRRASGLSDAVRWAGKAKEERADAFKVGRFAFGDAAAACGSGVRRPLPYGRGSNCLSAVALAKAGR